MDSLLGILLVIAIVVVDSLQSKRRKKSQQNHALPTDQPDPSALTEITPEEFIERMKKQWLAPFEASSHDDDENAPSGTDPVPKEDPPPERAPKEKPPVETPARHSGMPIEEPGHSATLVHAGHDHAGYPLRQAPAAVRDLKEPSLAIGNDNPLATLKATSLSASHVGMKGRRLTRDDWRKGIIMAAIFGPPRGDQPYELP